jgi:hypothetical protein
MRKCEKNPSDSNRDSVTRTTFEAFWDFSFWGGSGLVGGPTLKNKTKSETSEQNSQHDKFEFRSISATNLQHFS